MKLSLLTLLALIALTACEPINFQKPGGNPDQTYMDGQACRLEVAKEDAGQPFSMKGVNNTYIYNTCMKSKGYEAAR